MIKYTETMTAEQIIYFIANDRPELSHEKVRCQRNDYILMCRKWLKEHEPIVWSVADVLEIRPDLTDEQALEVLERAKRFEATLGIKSDVLDYHASWLFPEPEFSGWGS